jgi:CBS domain-containing protein
MLASAAKLMQQNNVGAIVITERNRPVGIVTDRDLAMGALPQRSRPDRHGDPSFDDPGR